MSLKKIIFTLLLLAVPVLFAIVTNALEGASPATGSGNSSAGFNDCQECKAALSGQGLTSGKPHCDKLPANSPCYSTEAGVSPAGATKESPTGQAK